MIFYSVVYYELCLSNHLPRMIRATKSTLPAIQRVIKKNDVFEHYKGAMYRVNGFVRHTETDEVLVVYQDIKKPDEMPWGRPVEMFNDYVIVENLIKEDPETPYDPPKLRLRFEQIITQAGESNESNES